MSSIEPTKGRVLHFFMANNTAGFSGKGGDKFAAVLCGINEDGTVNACVYDEAARPFPKQGLRLVQPGDDAPAGDYLCWMGFQIGQTPASQSLAAQVLALEGAVALLADHGLKLDHDLLLLQKHLASTAAPASAVHSDTMAQPPSLSLGIEHPAESQTITSADVGGLSAVLGEPPKQE